MKVVKEDVIQVPVEKVFDFVSDPERRPLFVPNLVGLVNITPAERGVGQSWEYQASLVGVSLQGKASCTIYEPNERYGIRTEGALSSTWLYSFAPEERGTRVRVEIEYDPPASVLAKLANTALLSRLNDSDATRGLQNLKIILEE